MRTYWSPVSPDFVPRSAISAACLFKLRNCSCLALWYSGMKIGPGGACALLNGSVLQPGCECGPVLVAEAPLKEFRRLLLIIELGGEPTVEGVAVVDPLLPCQSGKAFGSDSAPTRLGVLLCASSSPRCCLIPAPRGGHGDQGEDQRLDNFNRLKAALEKYDRSRAPGLVS